MRKSFLLNLLLTVLFLSITLFQNTYALTWIETIGKNEWDAIYSACSAQDGGFVVTGITSSGNHSDIWIAKLNYLGQLEWQKSLGTEADDAAYSIIQAHPSGYIIAGYEGYSLSFSTDNNTWNIKETPGNIWIAKLDGQGNVEWQEALKGNESEIIYSLTPTDNDTFIASGCTNSYGPEDMNAIILKFDYNGNIKWQKVYGGDGYDCIYSAIKTRNNGILAVGETSSGLNNTGILIMKLDPEGEVEWQKAYIGNFNSIAYTVTSADNGYILAGYTTINTESSNNTDFWNIQKPYPLIIKIDTIGNIEWQKILNIPGVTRAITKDKDGNIYIAGYTISSANSFIDNDIWIIKMDSEGNIKWSSVYGGYGPDKAYTITVSENGSIFVAGATASFGFGDTDAWLIKFSNIDDLQKSNINKTTEITLKDILLTKVDLDFSVSPANLEKETINYHIYTTNMGSSYQYKENLPPVIDSLKAQPNTGYAPLEVIIMCEGHDPDGIIVNYEITIGNNTYNGSNISYTFLSPGNYTVYCTIKDNSGDIDQESINVEVLPQELSPQPIPSKREVKMVNPQKENVPVKVQDSKLYVQFNYLDKVDILVGFISCDFKKTYWLNPNTCKMSEKFGSTGMTYSLNCNAIEMPENGGYILWLVSPKSIQKLDFKKDPYILKFYKINCKGP